MISIFQRRTNAVLERLISELESDLENGRGSNARDDLTELQDVYQEYLDNGSLNTKQQEYYDECICRCLEKLQVSCLARERAAD